MSRTGRHVLSRARASACVSDKRLGSSVVRVGERGCQSARDVADRAARLELVERGDLADATGPLLTLDVRDDLVAPVRAEVDVEGRRSTVSAGAPACLRVCC